MEVINITKIVKCIVGQFLEENGFVYHKDVNIWHYDRKKGEITQNIVIQRHRYFAGYIKVIFYTDAYGQGMREFRNFVPDMADPFQEFWEYGTEKELKEVLSQFVEWIRKYGFVFLESISVPTTEIRPKKETGLFLYKNHNEIYERYKKDLELNSMDGEEIIEVIWENIEKLYDKPFSEVEMTLIELAAVYGHVFCIDGIGEWEWDERMHRCWVNDAGGVKISMEPLKMVILAYDRHKNILEEKYMTQLRCRNGLLKLKQRNMEF